MSLAILQQHMFTLLVRSVHVKPHFKVSSTFFVGKCIHRTSKTASNPHITDHFKTYPGKVVNPIPGKPIINPDGLTRYPTLTSSHGILRTLDWIGTVAFATSGTITAGYAGLDLLGCTIVGTITSIGGGTVRDLLLGQTPVFWMLEYEYIMLCLLASVCTFYTWKDLEDNGNGIITENGMHLTLACVHFIIFLLSNIIGRFMFWTDTIGVGAFCVIGMNILLKVYKRCIIIYAYLGAQNAIRMNLLYCVECLLLHLVV